MLKMKLGTHNGVFHCDEILALAMLRQLPEYRNADLVRSRDPVILQECDVLFDVGAEFDPDRHRYDHHQASFNKTIRDFYPDIKPVVKLSSAGLIYVHFGKRVIASILGEQSPDSNVVRAIFPCLYATFISEVDGIDNGVPAAPVPLTYSIHTDLSARVGRCNRSWNRPDEDETECFNRAFKLVESELVATVRNLAETWYPAYSIVKDALLSRHSVHSSGAILRLAQSCPWKLHFFELEKEVLGITDCDIDENTDFKDRPVFVIVERNSDCGKQFSLTSIPCHPNLPFSKRVPLVAAWAGKRDEELCGLVGLSGCVFVHTSLFLGIHETFDGALQMAIMSLKAANYL
ncbi:MYG1 exonuclease [Taenia crassiceps]|uniref:MYG1 exonuclease n=1 Tax=Taenia crassiceps TaxID=6207 RepID=A0ABR4QJX1_9CEST